MKYDNISQVMENRVIQLVSGIELHELYFFNQSLLERLFLAVVAGELSQLKKIRISDDISFISPELLSQAVVRLEEFEHELCYSELSTDQLRAILDKIIQTEDLKLKILVVSSGRLHEIPEDIIMMAAVKLEETDIYHKFGWRHNGEWYKFIAETPVMNIKRLQTNCYDVPPNVVAAALVRVEEVRAEYLSDNQYLALFNKIVNREDIKMRKLDIDIGHWLSMNSLSHIPPDILAESVVRLELISLFRTKLTPNQVRSIFLKIADCENHKLTKQYLGGSNLSSAREDLLVKAGDS